VVTAFVVAVATTFGNSIGQKLFNDVTAPKGQPIVIESAQYLAPLVNSFAFPQQLSPAQVAQVASFHGNTENYQSYVNNIAAHGGVLIAGAVVEVVLFGNARETSVISNIEIRPQCTTPPSGTLIFLGSAGTPPSARLGFNLDSPVPIAQNITGFIRLSGNYFADRTITVSPGETQTLDIYALSSQRYCTFTYQLYVDTPNGQVVETVTNHGRPFAVSGGLPGNSCYRAEYGGGVAMPSTTGQFTLVPRKLCKEYAHD
jgi:hypothetical protein